MCLYMRVCACVRVRVRARVHVRARVRACARVCVCVCVCVCVRAGVCAWGRLAVSRQGSLRKHVSVGLSA